MAGSIRKVRDGVWELRVSVGRDDTGKYRQISRTVKAANKTAANKALRELHHQIDQGLVNAPTSITVGDAVDAWLEFSARDLAPSTIHGYRALTRQRIHPNLGHLRLDELTAAHLDRLYLAMSGEGLAASTVRHVHSILRKALGQAVKWDQVERNVAEKATPPPVRQARITAPTPEHVAKLVRAAEESDMAMAVAVRLAASTGMRRGELCALRWSDLVGGRVRVARSITAIGGRTYEKGTKTHGRRWVTLDDVTASVVEEHRGRMAARGRFAPEGFVFTEAAAGYAPWHPDSVTKRFSRLCGKVGLRFRFHDLRHFSAAQLVADNVDVLTVAGRLGHRDPSVTLRVYGDYLPAADTAAAKRMGGILD